LLLFLFAFNKCNQAINLIRRKKEGEFKSNLTEPAHFIKAELLDTKIRMVVVDFVAVKPLLATQKMDSIISPHCPVGQPSSCSGWWFP
jgi:hypothetical protein